MTDQFWWFLRELDLQGAEYTLDFPTALEVPIENGSIVVAVTASEQERWEVEFFRDGEVQLERFVSAGAGPADLTALLDELTPPE